VGSFRTQLGSFLFLGWSGALAFAVPDEGTRRLSSPLPRVPGADVFQLVLSPDGTRVVYWVTGLPGETALYSVAADGSSTPVLLATVGQGRTDVTTRISPDGTRVFYTTTGYPGMSLFKVPIDGSAAPVDLVGPHVKHFDLSPHGGRVVYVADVPSDGRFLVYSAPMDGSSSPIILMSSLVAGGDAEELQVTPDGTHVIYRADQDVDRDERLYSAQIDVAASSVEIGGNAAPPFQITPDGTRVVYRAGAPLALYSAPVDGSAAAIRISDAVTSGHDVLNDFQVAPDGVLVVYRSDKFVDGRFELFSVPTDGITVPTRLNQTLSADGDVDAFHISADSTHVVYRANPQTKYFELYSVPTDGSTTAVKLSQIQPGEDVLKTFRIEPDSARVAFLVGGVPQEKLFSAPLDASAPPLLLDDHAASSFVPTSGEGLQITPDSQRVLYRRTTPGGQELRAARLAGGSPPIDLSAGDTMNDYRLSPDGTFVVYAADERVNDVQELFRRPVTAGASSTQLSQSYAPDSPGGSVYSFRAGAARVVYVADQDSSGVVGLYSVPLHGRRPRLRLSDTTGGPIDVLASSPIEFAAGETRVVYHGWIANREWLFS